MSESLSSVGIFEPVPPDDIKCEGIVVGLSPKTARFLHSKAVSFGELFQYSYA